MTAEPAPTPQNAAPPGEPAVEPVAVSGDPSEAGAEILAALGSRPIVLVGMMGAGKTSIGKRLAGRFDLPFRDADAEIEAAAQATIPEIFERHGEPYFRDGERRVILRLLGEGRMVLATGGGAFMNAETRAAIKERGVAIWLRADLDVLLARVRRRSNRPLLQGGDPEATMRRLVEERYPVYAEAHLQVHSRDVAHDQMVDEILLSLAEYLRVPGPPATP